MRIMITGAEGQLGQALQPALSSHELIPVDIAEMDITSGAAVSTLIGDRRPDVVIHCAAYTNVDGCARDPELAYAVNALGTHHVALACQEIGAALVHMSTNEVFAGSRPDGYEEWMSPSPINPYGASKAASEAIVRGLVVKHTIVRTAWLFAPGGRNFLHAILRVARRDGAVRVVADEIGNPTFVSDLARAIAQLVEAGQTGIFHLVNEGSCSRWEFASEILRQAGMGELVNTPILQSDFDRLSTPPRFGALLNRSAAALGIRLRPWQEALADFLKELGEFAP